jgi:hypothetical protein
LRGFSLATGADFCDAVGAASGRAVRRAALVDEAAVGAAGSLAFAIVSSRGAVESDADGATSVTALELGAGVLSSLSRVDEATATAAVAAAATSTAAKSHGFFVGFAASAAANDDASSLAF